MGARLRDRALGRRTHLTTPTQHPAAAIAAHQDGPLALGRALAHLDRMANAARDRQSAAGCRSFLPFGESKGQEKGISQTDVGVDPVLAKDKYTAGSVVVFMNGCGSKNV